MNNRCGRCKMTGHFASRCTVNIDDANFGFKTLAKYATDDNAVVTTKKVVAVTNTFAALDDSTEEESPRTPRVKKTPEQTACPWAPVKKNAAELSCPTTTQKKQQKAWADYESDDE